MPESHQPALVSIVLSFRNEAASIPELLDRLMRTLSQAAVRYELIFVNDASTDESLALLTDRAARDPRIKIATIKSFFELVWTAVTDVAGAKP